MTNNPTTLHSDLIAEQLKSGDHIVRIKKNQAQGWKIVDWWYGHRKSTTGGYVIVELDEWDDDPEDPQVIAKTHRVPQATLFEVRRDRTQAEQRELDEETLRQAAGEIRAAVECRADRLARAKERFCKSVMEDHRPTEAIVWRADDLAEAEATWSICEQVSTAAAWVAKQFGWPEVPTDAHLVLAVTLVKEEVTRDLLMSGIRSSSQSTNLYTNAVKADKNAATAKWLRSYQVAHAERAVKALGLALPEEEDK